MGEAQFTEEKTNLVLTWLRRRLPHNDPQCFRSLRCHRNCPLARSTDRTRDEVIWMQAYAPHIVGRAIALSTAWDTLIAEADVVLGARQ